MIIMQMIFNLLASEQTELLDILYTDTMKYKNKLLGLGERRKRNRVKLWEIGVVSYCSVNGE